MRFIHQVVNRLFRIYRSPALGNYLKQSVIPLLQTPRQFTAHPINPYIYLVEADHRVVEEPAINPNALVCPLFLPCVLLPLTYQVLQSESGYLPRDQTKGRAGSWVSYIHVVDPLKVRRPCFSLFDCCSMTHAIGT